MDTQSVSIFIFFDFAVQKRVYLEKFGICKPVKYSLVNDVGYYNYLMQPPKKHERDEELDWKALLHSKVHTSGKKNKIVKTLLTMNALIWGKSFDGLPSSIFYCQFALGAMLAQEGDIKQEHLIYVGIIYSIKQIDLFIL